jgi:hypothetical protein
MIYNQRWLKTLFVELNKIYIGGDLSDYKVYL